MTTNKMTVENLLDGQWYTIADLTEELQRWGKEKLSYRLWDERLHGKFSQEEILEILEKIS